MSLNPFHIVRRHKLKLTVLVVVFYFCLPSQLFNDPTSTVVFDRNGQLLGARIAEDGQWRFPFNPNIPDKFKLCITTFEDKRFYSHHGVDPTAIGRAIKSNISNGEVVSGASTLTMQVIRLSRKGKARSIWQKGIESFQALRLETLYSKDEIMALYANNAPFGGNVVGLDAAAWKYYGRSAEELTWSEMSTLAVLPNSPSLIHPGRNRDALRNKRNRLLKRLKEKGHIAEEEYALSLFEPLPERPLALPNIASHLVEHLKKENNQQQRWNKITRTTIDASIQQKATAIINREVLRLSQNEINNAAALIIDTHTGEVLAYVGNSTLPQLKGSSCDLIRTPRSTGSILKPFLYAALFDKGELLPNQLVTDVPTHFHGYTPKNYDHEYYGAVPAGEALARSLNVPAARLLSEYGQPVFYQNLKTYGMTTLHQPASHYGLSLILGGAETTLWDLGAMYSGMGRTLLDYQNNSGTYSLNCFRPLSIRKKDFIEPQFSKHNALSAAAIWHTFEAMTQVNRPMEEDGWQQFASKKKIAWKTGTSFGFRDGWAVGCTPDYVVSVWVGNANGEGRPGLTGTTAAAPILFELFNMLPEKSEWFYQPFDDMFETEVCITSGCKAGPHCTHKKMAFLPLMAKRAGTCIHHQNIFLDSTERYRVTGLCEDPTSMVAQSFFVLPPTEAFYYAQTHPDYRSLPPFKKGCFNQDASPMEFIYPKMKTTIYVPVGLDGLKSETVFELKHEQPEKEVFWHLDGEFIGTTTEFHQIAFAPTEGKHALVVTDEDGMSVVKKFEIVARL